MMKCLKTLFVLLVIIFITSACQGSPLTAGENMTPEEVVGVKYDAKFALETCGDRPVDSFDPVTGKVECAQWLPLPEEKQGKKSKRTRKNFSKLRLKQLMFSTRKVRG